MTIEQKVWWWILVCCAAGGGYMVGTDHASMQCERDKIRLKKMILPNPNNECITPNKIRNIVYRYSESICSKRAAQK